VVIIGIRLEVHQIVYLRLLEQYKLTQVDLLLEFRIVNRYLKIENDI